MIGGIRFSLRLLTIVFFVCSGCLALQAPDMLANSQEDSGVLVEELERRFDGGPWLARLQRNKTELSLARIISTADSLIEGYSILRNAFTIALRGQDLFTQNRLQREVETMRKKMLEQVEFILDEVGPIVHDRSFREANITKMETAKKLAIAVDRKGDFIKKVESYLTDLCLLPTLHMSAGSEFAADKQLTLKCKYFLLGALVVVSTWLARSLLYPCKICKGWRRHQSNEKA